jgi:nitrite reductase (NO-forming)
MRFSVQEAGSSLNVAGRVGRMSVCLLAGLVALSSAVHLSPAFAQTHDHRMAQAEHSVDFHAATGPGGGAHVTQIAPGEEAVVTFKALKPGIYVYHCATPSVAHHITSGMYGLVLVEPEGGLPQVDREFYVMQGELYTVDPFGTQGDMEMDYDKLISESPEYFVFNGSVGALSKSHPLYANAGETVRIFFGVGGPNFTSSFHVIGEIFDNVFSMGSVTSPPLTGVQTVTVAPGGATIVDFKIDRGGNYILVDHALSRAERGLAGYLVVDGPENDDVMHAGPASSDPASENAR